MFHNYLVTALRNLARNKLYAGINIFGLAIGLAAVLLIALFVRDELSYDRFIPERDRSYLMTYEASIPGRSLMTGNKLPPELAAPLKLEMPGIDAIARLAGAEAVQLRHGDIESSEPVYWADPDFFRIVQLPVFAGDANAALSDPNAVVLTRRSARRIFGRENAIGETLELRVRGDVHPMHVQAVLEDLPSNTHLNTEIVASGLASFSGLSWFDANPKPASDFSNEIYLYFKLAAGQSIDTVQRALPAFLAEHKQLDPNANIRLSLLCVPLADIHLHAAVYGAMKPQGSWASLYGLSAVACLILLVSVINFVGLSTAQATERAMEIGVRKAAGAQRRDLIVQFLGESLLQVAIAAVIAVAFVEMALPSFNAFLDRTISIWSDRQLLTSLPIAIALLGLLAGFYPANLLSALKPVSTMGQQTTGSALRRISVSAQFAVLIGLVLATLVIERQTVFATTAALRLDTDQMLLIDARGCKTSFKDSIKALPGVRDAACSQDWPRNQDQSNNFAHLPNGDSVLVERIIVEPGLLELYGLKPIAGRFFSDSQVADSFDRRQSSTTLRLVINETAVRRFGFASANAATGQPLTLTTGDGARQIYRAEIIGVVTDFPRASIRGVVSPSVFFVQPGEFRLLSVKLVGSDLPATLNAIDKLWKASGEDQPISRRFLDQYIQEQYADLRRDTQMLAIFSAIALSVCSLGLFGFSAFTAELRTKEIGIRKAMGAGTGEVMRLLTWQFMKPVLWANLVAWPVAGYVMNRWLHGFAYRIDLSPWLFASATGVALLVAVLTVSVHCYLVARVKPIYALRYE